MRGRLHEFLATDHRRIDAFLHSAMGADPIDMKSYESFRGALLRHIGMEEKVLLPAARLANRGDPLAIATQLKADHSALAALLVPTPTPQIIDQVRALLSLHNVLEEEPDGLYDLCDRLHGQAVDPIIERLRAAPAVPLAPHFNGPRAFENIERLLLAAGRRKI